MSDLSPKQQCFVQEYLVDLNATQAAVRAGYSEKTAHVIAHENLRKPKVAEALQQAMDERASQTTIDAVWVLKETADVYREARETNQLPTALKAIELLGRHVGIQAFKDTARLEVELSVKAKAWLGIT